MTKIIKTIAASFLALLFAGSAQAALVNFEITGTVETAAADNSFGLLVGNTITASGVFDDIALTAGTGVIDFSTAYNNMTITAGTATYTDSTELFGGAYMELINGELDSLDYSSIANDFDSGFLSFWSGNLGEFDGSWNTAVSISSVPVPAAVWLFGSGLLALVGLSRRK